MTVLILRRGQSRAAKTGQSSFISSRMSKLTCFLFHALASIQFSLLCASLHGSTNEVPISRLLFPRTLFFFNMWFSHSLTGPSRRHLKGIPFFHDIVRALMDVLLVLRLNISPEDLSRWFLQLKNAFLPHTR